MNDFFGVFLLFFRKSVWLLLASVLVFLLFVVSSVWLLFLVNSLQEVNNFFLALPFFLFVFWLALTGFIRFRQRETFELQRSVAFFLESAFRGKINEFKMDKEKFVLVVIEFVFVTVVAVAITAYLDPDFAVVKWSNFGLFDPVVTILNVFLFLLIVGFIVYMWGYARDAYMLKKINENK